MKRISYIIPCYNCTNFIGGTLDNFIEHIHLKEDDYEIICVDDCSSDESYKVMEQYALAHPQVRVVRHKENIRQGGARNTGIQVAQGKYVAFGDHDDQLPNFDIKALLDEMDAKDLDMLMCDVNFQQWDKSMKQTPGLLRAINVPVSGVDVYEKEYMIEGGMLGVWSTIFKREYVRTLSPFADKVRVEDADWFMRAIGKAQRLEYRPVAIYNWMYYEDSQSHGMSAEMRADLVRRGLRQIEVAEELKGLSEKAYQYCYEDGIFTIKTATNVLWKRYTPAYRHRFLKQVTALEKERVLELHVNTRCALLFQYGGLCLVMMALTSFVYVFLAFFKKMHNR